MSQLSVSLASLASPAATAAQSPRRQAWPSLPCILVSWQGQGTAGALAQGRGTLTPRGQGPATRTEVREEKDEGGWQGREGGVIGHLKIRQ